MRDVFGIGILVAYTVIAGILVVRTFPHFQEQKHLFRPLDLFDPGVYTDRGNQLRRQALGYMVGAGCLLIGAMLLWGG